MTKKNATAAEIEMEMANAAIAPAETAEVTSRPAGRPAMSQEEKDERKAARKAERKAATEVVRKFLSSTEGKDWASAAGEFGQALMVLFPAGNAGSTGGPRGEVAKCYLVTDYIKEHGTVTDLEMFQVFKVGVAETRKLYREYVQKSRKANRVVNINIRRTEDNEGWEAVEEIVE